MLFKYLKKTHQNSTIKNDTDNTAISYLFGNKTILRGLEEYSGNEAYKNFIDNLNFIKIEETMSRIDQDFHFNNIEYLSQNNTIKSYLNRFNIKAKNTSDYTIVKILSNKAIQRLILNSDTFTREFIPKCFLFRMCTIKTLEDKIKLTEELLSHFNCEDELVFKIDECLGRGNYFVNIKKLRDSKKSLNTNKYHDKIIAFFNNPFFKQLENINNKIILVEEISTLGTFSRTPSKKANSVYRAAVVYHKIGNDEVLFNAMNIHLEKTDNKNFDSHKWNTGYHFALKEPRILNRTPKPRKSLQDAGNDDDYKYKIFSLDLEKAKRNQELKKYKRDLYFKFYKIAKLLGNFNIETFLNNICKDYVNTNKMGKIYISNIDNKCNNLIYLLDEIYFLNQEQPY